MATSGSYARGAHIQDPGTGRFVSRVSSATVVAPDAITANALATMLCVNGVERGFPILEALPGAHAMVVESNGAVRRTPAFSTFERPQVIRTALATAWPNGFQLTVQFTLTQGLPDIGGMSGAGGGGSMRPSGFLRHYVAVWIEDAQKKLVRVLAFWVSDERYYKELSTFVDRVGKNKKLFYSMARATRNPGRYGLLWVRTR